MLMVEGRGSRTGLAAGAGWRCWRLLLSKREGANLKLEDRERAEGAKEPQGRP